MESQSTAQQTNGTFLRTGEESNNRYAIIHSIQFIAYTSLTGCLFLLDFDSKFISWFFITLQLFLFAASGILHIHLFSRKSSSKQLSKFSVLFSITLALIISVALFLLYLVFSPKGYFMAIASGSAFLLPSVIHNAWKTYKQFSQHRFKIWDEYEDITSDRVTIFLNSMVLKIKLARRYFDIDEEVYEVTLPGHVPFGKLFNDFLVINKDKEHIEVIDENDNRYNWVFFIERKAAFGKRYIDPDLSLRENGLRDNQVIVGRRVRRVGKELETTTLEASS